MKQNTLGIPITDDAIGMTQAMETVTAAEFGKRVARAFLDSKSSTALFFIQRAFDDCEDDNGIYWTAFEEMLTRLEDEK